MIIDGKAYIPKEDMKTRIVKERIMDAANVAMIVNMDEEDVNDEGILEISFLSKGSKSPTKLVFKHKCSLSDCTTSIFGITWSLPENIGKYSQDYLKLANRVVSAINQESPNKKYDFDIYVAWDEKSKTALKDSPVLLRYGDLGIILAPRVEG